MQFTYAHKRKLATARRWAKDTYKFLRTDRSDATRAFLAVVCVVALWFAYQIFLAPAPSDASTTALITS